MKVVCICLIDILFNTLNLPDLQFEVSSVLILQLTYCVYLLRGTRPGSSCVPGRQLAWVASIVASPTPSCRRFLSKER